MNKPRKSIAPIIRLANAVSTKGIEPISAHLKPMQFSRYPPDNAITFERWFLNTWSVADECERIYLPIQWTALYCNNGYGNKPILHTIQKYLDGLDTTKKYYTIIQYDDGILNDISHLDLVVCAPCGPKIDFSLPLLCTPHKFNFTPKEVKKRYKASFIGNLTHVMRAGIIDQLNGNKEYYISTEPHRLYDYCKVISESKYVLCPRGYGKNSFRIQEAIDFGAIPVYISDEFVFPYNMPTFPFGVIVNLDSDLTIDQQLKSIEQTGIDKVARACIDANRKLFTYAGCKNEILHYLKSLQHESEANTESM